MADLARQSIENMYDVARKHCDSEVLAVGLVFPYGSMEDTLHDNLFERDLKKRANGLAKQTLVAVTSDKVYAFQAKPGLKTKVKKELAAWPKDDLTINRSNDRDNDVIKLIFEVASTGTRHEMETYEGGETEKFLSALTGS